MLKSYDKFMLFGLYYFIFLVDKILMLGPLIKFSHEFGRF
jgi:hypothetical protein